MAETTIKADDSSSANQAGGGNLIEQATRQVYTARRSISDWLTFTPTLKTHIGDKCDYQY